MDFRNNIFLFFICKIDFRYKRNAAINVIDNAIKYTPSGGRIDVAAAEAGDQSAQITVKDSGMGMGLAISQTIMTNHHGKIRADSWPGKGSKFTIELPPSVEAVASAVS